MLFPRLIKNDWVLVGTLPILLWLISDRWMFLPVEYWFDPWGALGAYLDYEYFSSLHPNSYCLARLPSIILHFFAYKFLDFYGAVVLTTLLKFYLCIIPLYWTLLELTKNRVASLVPIFLLSFYPFFLSSVGWHYVDGFGIAYISLATAFFIAACKKENWKLWLFLAGFFQALMVFNYLFVGVIAAIQVATFMVYNKAQTKKPVFMCALFLGLGALLCTACLSSFSYYFSGRALFFWPQVQAALHLSSEARFVIGKDSVWYKPFKQWFPRSTFLFLTALSFFLSIPYLFERLKVFKQKSFANLPFLIVLQFLLTCFVYIVQDFLGLWMLQNFFVASYLLPFSVLTLGVILSEKKLVLKREDWLIWGILGILYITFSFKGNAAVLGRSWGCVSVHFIGCVVFSMLFLKASKTMHKILYSTLSILCIVLAFNRLTLSSTHYPYKNHCDQALLVNLHRHIKNNIPSESHYLFWYNIETDKLSSFFQPLACTYLGNLLSSKFPEVSDPSLLERSKSTIILLSSDPEAVEKAEKSLRQKGYGWDILRQEKIQLGEKEFLLLAFLPKSLDGKSAFRP